jgi:16S rRNA (cytosine1402-N4)-methyltransferase
MSETVHVPVLLEEVLKLLDLKSGEDVVDGTVGGGGHTEALLERIGPEGRLLGIDADKEALERAKVRLKRFGERVTLVKGNFRNLKTIVREHFPYSINKILLDLGISSDQLEDDSRGFSFLSDGPLDMRMGGGRDATTPSAAEVANTFPEADLARIIRMWGEDRYARSIAHSIVVSRKETPFETTHQLVSAVLTALPPHARRPARWGRHALHPATRTFQALRIYVNDELHAVEEALPQAIGVMARGGRLAVIAFHSLEDRIVKQRFAEAARKKIVKIITRKPVEAGAKEVKANPRARSAKLRIIEKL